MQDNTHNLSSDTHSSALVPHSCFTPGSDTASLLSYDLQTAFLSRTLFSEVLIPTPVPPQIRIPEYYITEHSRPPTPNFADYPIRDDGTAIYEPKNDPRFTILTERFITINDSHLNKRKETELERLQTSKQKLEFGGKVKFQGLNPHPVFHVSKIEKKTSPAPFEVTHFDLERDPQFQN